MKWVKNTEESPVKSGKYFIAFENEGMEAFIFRDGKWFFPDGCCSCEQEMPEGWGDFKWLDLESSPWCSLGCSEDGRDGL